MSPAQVRLSQIAFWCMLVSASAIVVSIAVCQIFLGLALISVIASGAPLRFPPLKAPLALFVALTALALLFSGHPAAGLPQIRKFYVYTILLVASSVFVEARHARWLAVLWTGAATASSLRSLAQFAQKVEISRRRHEDFYNSYVGSRITGFLSHWMTFSEVDLLILLVLVGFLLFSPQVNRWFRFAGSFCAGILLVSLIASFTRSIWLATAVSVCYLIWHWRKKWLLLAPVILIAALAASPGAIKRRAESMLSARSDSSTSARVIMWRTGWRMIRAHPLLGVGPEQVGPQFRAYLPGDVTELPPAFYGHLHNLYIHYAAERGIPAMLALVWLLVCVLRDHARALARLPEPEDRPILHAVMAGTIAVLIGALFEVNLGDSEVLTVFLTLISLGYAAIARQARAAAAPEPGPPA